MKRNTLIRLALGIALSGLAVPAWANVLQMSDPNDPNRKSLELVTVGNMGNPSDTRYGQGCGSVSQEYSMGKFEVTAGQYCEFLNAVAKTDTYDLYSGSMWGARGGCRIQRTGTPGNYAYSVDNGHANRPVNYVDFWDACRFANWLTNNQPIGSQDANTTEDGSYYLNGYIGTDGHTIARKLQGRFFVPSQDEWYKSAYHKNDGVTGNYWDYQTQGNTAPTSQLPPGVAEPNGSANYNAVDQVNGITEVGAYTLSASAYDTFDQGGNVWEWDEQVTGMNPNYFRQLRGGGFLSAANQLGANSTVDHFPNFEDEDIGFRIVEVPEPATLSLLALGGLAILRRRSGRVVLRRG